MREQKETSGMHFSSRIPKLQRNLPRPAADFISPVRGVTFISVPYFKKYYIKIPKYDS